MSDHARLIVRPLRPEDHHLWLRLATGYKTFYRTELSDNDYELAWNRLLAGQALHGFGAELDGQLVGIVHCLFHASTWSDDVCYLQDLFVDESARGHGVAQALIEHVATFCKERGSPKLYWLTHSTNERARALYDRVAAHHGFIRYDYPLN